MGALALIKSDWVIAVSGIAGPGGGTKEKPVGLVYIGVKGPHYSLVEQCHFSGDRQSVREQSVIKGLQMLLQGLLNF